MLIDLGTLPANGTVCTADYSGLNNVFIANPISGLPASPPSKFKLIFGLVLGLGLLLVVGSIVAYGLWNLRRRSARKQAMARVNYLKNCTRITTPETS
jgi:hypothetical protein